MAKKLQYKIGDACKELDIQPYVLRYWETEFPFLNPSKSRSGQRKYGEREMKIAARIKELLYSEGYTIAGAKKKLEAEIGDGGELVPAEATGKGVDEPVPVDRAAEEQIRELRSGIESALAQTRGILEKLG